MPHASVIVPTYNSQSTIEQCLRAVRVSAFQDYELIVIDCGSKDGTCAISSKYADKVIVFDKNPGRNKARNRGMEAAKGNIIVNIDSDILIRPDTLSRIIKHFSKHQNIYALTGLLSKEHPNPDFFSQYKNLYMNYIFSRLPERVSFLYGSIHAVQRQTVQPYDSNIKIADDTALGQQLVSCGKQIAFLKDLQVVHLKKYNLFSFIKNDFQIPFEWAKIFLKYKGWRQLGRNKTGFAHASKEQLISVILAPVIFILGFTALLNYVSYLVLLSLILGWFFLNFRFIRFLKGERGLLFGILAFFVTFLDNIVMALGILCGLSAFFMIDMRRANIGAEGGS